MMDVSEALLFSSLITIGSVAFAAMIYFYFKFAIHNDWPMILAFVPYIAVLWVAMFLNLWL